MVDLQMDVLSFSVFARTKRGPKRLNVADMRVGRAMDKMTRRRRSAALRTEEDFLIGSRIAAERMNLAPSVVIKEMPDCVAKFNR